MKVNQYKKRIEELEKELEDLRAKYAEAKKQKRSEGELLGIQARGEGVKKDIELYKRILLAHDYGTGKRKRGGEK